MNIARHFFRHALTTPGRTAFVWESGESSYAGMLAIAEGIRRELASAGGHRVALLAHRSPVAYAGIQAILAEGSAYIPLNPGTPAQRNATILRKAGISTVVAGSECVPQLGALLSIWTDPLTVVTSGPVEPVRALAANHPNVRLREAGVSAVSDPTPLREPHDGTAYILFTSGSTGEPKGVRVLHSNVDAYLDSVRRTYPVSPDDRLSGTFDLTFDVSVHDQFVTWESGATLVVIPENQLLAPLEWARDKGITVWFSVPAIPTFLESSRLVEENALPGLRLSFFAGEKLTWNAVKIWKRIAPESRIANFYGPTEATVSITHFEIPADYTEARCFQGGVPIGRPFPESLVEILGDDGKPVATGTQGGLWLGGRQVAPGYLDPEKTAERFLVRDGVSWYRSGDLVFEDSEGNIQYVGREDFQVKVMGYRIELGEIEAVLLRETGAPFAIADVAAFRGEIEEIYCVLPSAHDKDKKRIKDALKKQLPPYMVPRRFRFTDDIPLNSNGKIDRKAIKDRLRTESAEA